MLCVSASRDPSGCYVGVVAGPPGTASHRPYRGAMIRRAWVLTGQAGARDPKGSRPSWWGGRFSQPMDALCQVGGGEVSGGMML